MRSFPALAAPLKVGNKTLKNRIVFGAHTANMAENGFPGERHIAYYKERAMGGAAMIVVEPMPVHPTAVLTRGNFRHCDDAVIPYFRKVVEACKPYGTVMIQQLYHVGQHGDADLSFQPNWSPSGKPSYHDSDGSHAVSEAQIEELITSFANAAKRCQLAGFDGVEVWAQYHSLIDQFWSPWSNHREDQWGGRLRTAGVCLAASSKRCVSSVVKILLSGFPLAIPKARTLLWTCKSYWILWLITMKAGK